MPIMQGPRKAEERYLERYFGEEGGSLRGVAKRFFTSKTEFDVGSRVGLEDGIFFLDAMDAINHYVADGGHMFEVEVEPDNCERGTVTEWLGSVSEVRMSLDENAAFEAVPDKKEILGRMEKKSQGRAFEHDPDGRAGKRWLRSYKEAATVAKELERIIVAQAALRR